jgi:DNA-binding GntR family transcriptional regulator
MIENGELLESARYNNRYYGTPLAPIDEALAAGRDILLEIDIQGARQVREHKPDAVMFFVSPPSMGELERRLRSRGDTSEEDIEQLRELLRKQEAALKGDGDPRQYDLQFHRLVAECAKNLPLKIMMNSVTDLTVEAISRIDLSADVQRHVLFFHKRVFEAIRRRDEEAAYKLMLRHVLEVQSRLAKTFSRTRSASRRPA